MQQTDERKWEGNEACPGHNANEKTQSNPQEANQRSCREIRSPVRRRKLRLFSSCFLLLFPQNALPGHNIRPGSRCRAIKRVSREPTQNAGVESGLNGKIEMFGLQGSSSSPTDPLFTRLSQDCPIRGLAMQTQRLLLVCNLSELEKKRMCQTAEWEDREIQGGSEG